MLRFHGDFNIYAILNQYTYIENKPKGLDYHGTFILLVNEYCSLWVELINITVIF